jgi:NitT/TauT family transport system permease protein
MKTIRVLLIPAVAMLVWIVVTQYQMVSELFLPKPSAVFHSFISLIATGDVIPDLLQTIGRVFTGFIIAVVIGVPLGAVMGLSSIIRSILEPSVDVLRSVPTTALLPLFMLLLGIGNESVIALITIPCLWTMVINTLYGVTSGNRARREVARLYKASSLQELMYVVIPDSLPFVVAGLRLAMVLALHMAIAAEMLVGSHVGLGRRLYDAQFMLRVPEMYALLLITGALGYALNCGWVSVEQTVIHWSGK